VFVVPLCELCSIPVVDLSSAGNPMTATVHVNSLVY
jgi:hypothetical protein